MTPNGSSGQLAERRRLTALCASFFILATTLTGSSAYAQFTSRVSLADSGAEGNNGVHNGASCSADGRFVAFGSLASNLVPPDTNQNNDIFVRDRMLNRTTRVSVSSQGAEGNWGADEPAISADGRYVVFSSPSSNLVSGDTNGVCDIFVHDRLTQTTTRVSVASDGQQANHVSRRPSISADGRYVAFESNASNLVAGDANDSSDIFLHDACTGQTLWVSNGPTGSGRAFNACISGDGRVVAFATFTALVAEDTNGVIIDVYVYELATGALSLVSVDSQGTPGNLDSDFPSLSYDGSRVAFISYATNLVATDTNGKRDAFVRDRTTGQTNMVSVSSSGVQGSWESTFPFLPGDGDYVVFSSVSPEFVPGDTNGFGDVFGHEIATGDTWRISVSSTGEEGNHSTASRGISSDGRFVVSFSCATNLIQGDTNGYDDAFVHGPELTLDLSATAVTAGDSLTMTTWPGNAGDPAVLFVAAMDGVPLWVPVQFGAFDSQGLFAVTATVPPGFAGVSLTLQAFARAPFSGKVEETNAPIVTLQ